MLKKVARSKYCNTLQYYCNTILLDPILHRITKKVYQRKQHHHALTQTIKPNKNKKIKKSHNLKQLLKNNRNKTHLNRIKTMLL